MDDQLDEVAERGTISRIEGRSIFGTVASVYAAARPEHPDRVYEVLRSRCGLGPSAHVLEIGAGSGQATRRLIESGASVVALEPSQALARELAARIVDGRERLEIVVEAFEDAPLPGGSFDLAVAASAFHWVDQSIGLAKSADVLRPGGWLALWWSIFGDPEAPDPFRDATDPLLRDLAQGPSAGERGVPFALDAEARITDIEEVGQFADIEHETVRWVLELDPPAVRRLYSTFSPIARLPERRRTEILDSLARIAADQFAGRVKRRMVTPIYTARRAA
jgi:SAM-dependent methyltransferase